LTDSLLLPDDTYGLLDIGKRGLALTKGSSGIYDLSTATLHFNERRLDLLQLNSSQQLIFRNGDLKYFQ
jgi:hypothetical protein